MFSDSDLISVFLIMSYTKLGIDTSQEIFNYVSPKETDLALGTTCNAS